MFSSLETPVIALFQATSTNPFTNDKTLTCQFPFAGSAPGIPQVRGAVAPPQNQQKSRDPSPVSLIAVMQRRFIFFKEIMKI